MEQEILRLAREYDEVELLELIEDNRGNKVADKAELALSYLRGELEL